MGTRPRWPRLLLITDPAFGDGRILYCVRAAARALPAGALGVQLRDKRRMMTSLRLFARELRNVTRAVGAPLLVNGLPGLAREIEADGVHLGAGAGSVAQARKVLGDRAWISVAAHSDHDVHVAVEQGADAVLVSPIFPTHPPREILPALPKVARGVAALRSARESAGSRLAVVALGGVGPENAASCALAGADGAAVIRALLASAEPGAQARAIHDVWAGRW